MIVASLKVSFCSAAFSTQKSCIIENEVIIALQAKGYWVIKKMRCNLAPIKWANFQSLLFSPSDSTRERDATTCKSNFNTAIFPFFLHYQVSSPRAAVNLEQLLCKKPMIITTSLYAGQSVQGRGTNLLKLNKLSLPSWLKMDSKWTQNLTNCTITWPSCKFHLLCALKELDFQ